MGDVTEQRDTLVQADAVDHADTVPTPDYDVLWEMAVRRFAHRLHQEQGAETTDLLSDSDFGVVDEQSFRDCVGRTGCDDETIDFAVESVRCLAGDCGSPSDEDEPTGRHCIYPEAMAEVVEARGV